MLLGGESPANVAAAITAILRQEVCLFVCVYLITILCQGYEVLADAPGR